jgi:hypothetical protein
MAGIPERTMKLNVGREINGGTPHLCGVASFGDERRFCASRGASFLRAEVPKAGAAISRTPASRWCASTRR